MLGVSPEMLRARAASIAAGLVGVAIVDTQGHVGGGSLPHARIASVALAIASERPNQLAARLRRAAVPIVGRIEDGRLLLDLRTVHPRDDARVAETLRPLFS